jgi:hypothetical protein
MALNADPAVKASDFTSKRTSLVRLCVVRVSSISPTCARAQESLCKPLMSKPVPPKPKPVPVATSPPPGPQPEGAGAGEGAAASGAAGGDAKVWDMQCARVRACARRV